MSSGKTPNNAIFTVKLLAFATCLIAENGHLSSDEACDCDSQLIDLFLEQWIEFYCKVTRICDLHANKKWTLELRRIAVSLQKTVQPQDRKRPPKLVRTSEAGESSNLRPDHQIRRVSG